MVAKYYYASVDCKVDNSIQTGWMMEEEAFTIKGCIHSLGTGTNDFVNPLLHRYVSKFVPRKERLRDGSHNIRYTNVYVKNFGDDFTSDNLRREFEKFGVVVGAVVMKDETGKSKGFGFVSFDDHKAAARVRCLCVCLSICVCTLYMQ